MHHPDYMEIGRRFRHTSAWNDAQPLSFPDQGVDLFYPQFQSRRTGFLLGHDQFVCEEHGLCFHAEPTMHVPPDSAVPQNVVFRYPLVREATSRRRHRHGIMILHGLNERSFSKYISWAFQLWATVGAPVVLFPLTFHINRVSPSWALGQADDFAARKAIPGNEYVHRFNAVISERLGGHPERFFWGAIQSYWDIVDFVRDVRSGRNPHFEPDAELDFLGFSAGGYVSLALLLDSAQGLFDSSRAVVFASGTSIRDVTLTSNLIVDQAAETSLMNLYVKHRQRLAGERLLHWMDVHSEGRWFNAYCGLMPNRQFLEPRLAAIAPRVLSIANTNDQVFPSGAIHNAMQGVHRSIPIRVEELELGVHENPFACPDYEWGDRRMITEFLDVERFGTAFEKFINLCASHFAR